MGEVGHACRVRSADSAEMFAEMEISIEIGLAEIRRLRSLLDAHGIEPGGDPGRTRTMRMTNELISRSLHHISS
jgi:hypothetical protein